MKRIAFLVVAIAAVAGVVASPAPTSGRADDEAVPIFGIKIPTDTATGGWFPWPTKTATSTVSLRFWATMQRSRPTAKTSDGKSGDEALLKTCAPCHAKASRDFVFTRYAP
jgi:hypothetical protein